MALDPLPNFKSLDERTVFEDCREAIFSNATKNVVVEFDSGRAYAVKNLDEVQLKSFLDTPRDSGTVTRWINIFGPERQHKAIRRLAEKYDFTSRLTSIICTAPPWPTMFYRPRKSQDQKTALSNKVEINHYRLVDNVWHFCSTDWSSRCLCIGYNSLSNLVVTDPSEESSDEDSRRKKIGKKIGVGRYSEKPSKDVKSKPKCRRLWNWLLICDDNTVISIQESPKPQESVRSMRRNMANVFRHLSKVKLDAQEEEQALDTLDIRPNCTTQGSVVEIADSAALLYYYLFDDWYTSYNLVATDDRYAYVLQSLVSQCRLQYPEQVADCRAAGQDV